MATATINGITLNLSADEMLTLVKSIQSGREPVSHAPVERVIEKVVKRAAKKQGPTNTDKHQLDCGCYVEKSRGRYPSMCKDCLDNAEKEIFERPAETEKPVERKSNSSKSNYRRSGKREFNQEQYDAWLSEHADEPMSEKWEKRIRWMIEKGYKLSQTQRAKFLARLDRDPRLTVHEAHGLRNEIANGYKRA